MRYQHFECDYPTGKENTGSSIKSSIPFPADQSRVDPTFNCNFPCDSISEITLQINIRLGRNFRILQQDFIAHFLWRKRAKKKISILNYKFIENIAMQSYVITRRLLRSLESLIFNEFWTTETRYLRNWYDVLLTGAVLMNRSLRIYTAPLLREYRLLGGGDKNRRIWTTHFGINNQSIWL